ncbi:Flp pilus assembly pilin Flp [Rhodoblastus sphagnicola]|nr:Flp family type IVb pilin [Rhodoblastus sphagnicola]MBB4196471.1 Flp pilus assembly pilin Flp [Rhodoblastus sphagnicola]
MKRSWLHFLKASEGMAVVEYALLAALLAVAAISGLNMLGAKVNSHYQAISNAMN